MAHAARPFATGEIAVSDFVRRVLIDEYRLPAHRVHTAYRWRDLDRIERTALAGRRTAASGPVLGTIGRLDWMKDHASVIRALAILRRSLPGARLVIVGEGSDREALAALARELGVAEHVALVGHQADVAQRSAAWIFSCSPRRSTKACPTCSWGDRTPRAHRVH